MFGLLFSEKLHKTLMNTATKNSDFEKSYSFGRWSFRTLFVPKGVKAHVFMLNYGHPGSVHSHTTNTSVT